MTTPDQVLAAIGPLAARTVEEIAAAVCESPDAVRPVLRQMDDAGQLLMRGGFYRQSEAVKCARG